MVQKKADKPVIMARQKSGSDGPSPPVVFLFSPDTVHTYVRWQWLQLTNSIFFPLEKKNEFSFLSLFGLWSTIHHVNSNLGREVPQLL